MAHLQPTVAARNVRERTEEEMEPATFKLATGPATGQDELAPVQMVRIRSTHSVHEAIIEFVNESGRPVRAIWLDFAGNEVAYTVIEPSTKRRYRTYVSHPWIIRDVSSGSRMMLGTSMVIVASSAEHKVVISSPPPLAWTLDTHKFYPEPFKAEVRALLLAHQRVRNGPACSHPQAPTPFSLAASTAAPFSTTPHACPSVCGSVYCDSSSSAGLLAGSTSTSSLDQMMMDVDGPPMAAPLPASMLMDCPAAVSSCADALYSTTPSTLAPSNTTPASLISSMSSSLADMLDVDMSDAAPSLNPTPLSSVAPSTRASYQHLLPPRYPQAPATAALALQSAPLYGQQHPQQQQQLCSRSSSGDCSAFCTGHAAPLSPRTFQKAARMFGWVVEKVVHAVKSPIRAAPPRALPKPQPPLSRCVEQPCSTRADGPLLELMEQLPTHLVLHIVALMAPRDVMQCITRGPAEAHPDVSPALLQSDPATWPAVTAPQELLPQQPMQQ